MSLSKCSLAAMREDEEKRQKKEEERRQRIRGWSKSEQGAVYRRKLEREEERNNFVLTLVGATLNCGLPTLINFGRFISSCSTRLEEGWLADGKRAN